jgi:hypothetical protein
MTTPIVWMVVAMLPVAALTASAVPWKWGFALIYVATAFALQTLVRMKSPQVERFAHILVLSGSAPFAVRFYFGGDLSVVGAVHVAAVVAICIGVGYLLADRVRPQVREPAETRLQADVTDGRAECAGRQRGSEGFLTPNPGRLLPFDNRLTFYRYWV